MTEKIICPDCEGPTRKTVKELPFEYGAGDDYVVLSAEVPVWECVDEKCGYLIGNWEAEEIRDAAVEKYKNDVTIYRSEKWTLNNADLDYILEHADRLEAVAHEKFDGYMEGGDSEMAYTTIRMLRRLVRDLHSARKTETQNAESSIDSPSKG